MWKSAYGLILEGKILDSDHPDMLTPKLLVLQHPLDDFTRIVSKQNKSLVEWKNNRHQLLMVCENPSLAGKLNLKSMILLTFFKIYFHFQYLMILIWDYILFGW